MVIVAALLGMAMIALRNDVGFPLVIVWALVGIAVARSAIPAIAVASVAGAAAVFLAWVVARLRR
jgi:hypothetical protein